MRALLARRSTSSARRNRIRRASCRAKRCAKEAAPEGEKSIKCHEVRGVCSKMMSKVLQYVFGGCTFCSRRGMPEPAQSYIWYHRIHTSTVYIYIYTITSESKEYLQYTCPAWHDDMVTWNDRNIGLRDLSYRFDRFIEEPQIQIPDDFCHQNWSQLTTGRFGKRMLHAWLKQTPQTCRSMGLAWCDAGK